MKTQIRAYSMPILVCMVLISKLGMMLHELEHDPLSEEVHYCAICLSGAPLESAVSGSGSYLSFFISRISSELCGLIMGPLLLYMSFVGF